MRRRSTTRPNGVPSAPVACTKGKVGAACAGPDGHRPMALRDPSDALPSLDGDGRVDLAVTSRNPGARVTVLRGHGDGTF